MAARLIEEHPSPLAVRSVVVQGGHRMEVRVNETETIPESRRRNMQAIRGKDSRPEMTVRRLLHGMGYRYLLHDRRLPGTPDLVFPSRRKVIEVRGCFFHRHPDPTCRNTSMPKTRRDFWERKFAANIARDARNGAALADLGWQLLVIWECGVSDPELPERLVAFLGARS